MSFLPRRRPVALLYCAAMLTILACEDAVQPQGVDLEIRVDETQATVTWDKRHRVDKLIMFGSSPWIIANESGLTPPIRYREVPAGAEQLLPAAAPFDPSLDHYSVALVRSDRSGDHLVAVGAVGGDPVRLPEATGTFVYAPRVVRTTPDGVVPPVFEFASLAAIPNASWKTLTDEADVEALLQVGSSVLQMLYRTSDNTIHVATYTDLRVAEVDGDGGKTYFIWDQVSP